MLNPLHYVQVPADKLDILLQNAFKRSGGDELTPEELTAAKESTFFDARMAGRLDTIRGKEVKLTVWRHPDDPTKVMLAPYWYGHPIAALAMMLEDAGVEDFARQMADAHLNRKKNGSATS